MNINQSNNNNFLESWRGLIEMRKFRKPAFYINYWCDSKMMSMTADVYVACKNFFWHCNPLYTLVFSTPTSSCFSSQLIHTPERLCYMLLLHAFYIVACSMCSDLAPCNSWTKAKVKLLCLIVCYVIWKTHFIVEF